MANHICHFEIGGRDLARSHEFYGKLFDWTFQDQGHSIMVRAGGEISGHLNSLGHEPENYVTFYVMVDDVQESLDKAVEAGGKALVGPVDIGTGIFGWFSDLDGNIIGVYTEKPQAA